MQRLQHCLKYVPDDRYMASCLLFALKNTISRGMEGVFDNFWNFQGGGGVSASSLKWKIRRGGGSYMIFPPWWGYGYFLELHINFLYHAIENTANQNAGKPFYIRQYSTKPSHQSV